MAAETSRLIAMTSSQNVCKNRCHAQEPQLEGDVQQSCSRWLQHLLWWQPKRQCRCPLPHSCRHHGEVLQCPKLQTRSHSRRPAGHVSHVFLLLMLAISGLLVLLDESCCRKDPRLPTGAQGHPSTHSGSSPRNSRPEAQLKFPNHRHSTFQLLHQALKALILERRTRSQTLFEVSSQASQDSLLPFRSQRLSTAPLGRAHTETLHHLG
mmetsp:Transcript_41660/g.89446  ORF Transcript_41660/g.89446 Transcript_41660/m.89446 type:complete len:209 (+) Transcript_41660:332-958(+)